MMSYSKRNFKTFAVHIAILSLIVLETLSLKSTESLFPTLSVRGNGIEITSGVLNVSKLNFTDFGVAKGNNEFSELPDDIHEFTIINTGSTQLDIVNISLTNQTSSEFFTIEEAPGGSLGSGESKTLKIGFTRVGYGIGIAEISIVTNDAANPNFTFFVKVDSQFCVTCDNTLHTGVMCEKCQPRYAPDSYPNCDVCVEPNMVDDCTSCRFPAADITNNCQTCTDPFRTPPRCIF